MSLNEIKLKIKEAPVSSVIGSYINLSSRGSGQFIGLCPFHQDSRPSLHVHDAKGLFKCFACGVGGDAISFVENYTKMPFIDCLHEIGKILGIPTEDLLKKDHEKDPRFVLGQKILQKAAELYQQIALKQKPDAFITFLRERMIDEKTAEKFMLGYSPGNDALRNYLQSIPSGNKSELFSLAQELGVLREGPKDRTGKSEIHDAFRERIIFPIQDAYGHVVAFGSRAVFAYQKPKYINSKDSFIFNKRNILYGLNLAKAKIREKNQVILVEGYMDLITLSRLGFDNVVAVMGIALSERSIATLAGLTKNILLALDSDAAGWTAMERMSKDLAKHQIVPRYLDFSPAKDPDEYLVKYSKESLEERIKKAPLFLSVQLEKTLPAKGEIANSDMSEKIAILEKIFPILSPLKTDLLATEKLEEVKEHLGLRTASKQLLENYKKYLLEIEKGDSGRRVIHELKEVKKRPSPTSPLIPRFGGLGRFEKALLKEVLLHPSCLQHSELTHLLENVVQDEVKKIFVWLKSLYFEIDESEYVSTVMSFVSSEGFSVEIKALVGSILFQYGPQEPMDDKVVKRLLKDFSLQKEKRQVQTLKRSLMQEENEEDEEKLTEELLNTQKRLNELRILAKQ